ncbi:hypothetical protein ACQUQP_16970 [Marinobacterium sp. YM272]|uniref:hypothetical protein n=1 Tax=Marinobacterium sp. YM272 TaxID=3421654 RepID=UPI003D7F6669
MKKLINLLIFILSSSTVQAAEYEYIDAQSFGESKESLELDENEFSPSILRGNRINSFPVGTGKCQNFIDGLDDRYMRIAIAAHQSHLFDNGLYKHVKYLYLRCVRVHEVDQECVDYVRNAMPKTLSPRDQIWLDIKTRMDCRKKEVVYEGRVFQSN